LEAEELEIARDQEELLAHRNVYSLFRPSGTSAGGAEAERFVVRSDSLRYEHERARAQYEGSVQVQSARGMLHAAQLELFFRSGEQETVSLSAIGGQLERIQASGDVLIVQGERRATGDRAEYGDGDVHLYGQMASISDPQKGTTRGAELTYLVADDTILVEGKPGLPTETQWNVHP
jgi:lipopolysaccharide export system protein LptA